VSAASAYILLIPALLADTNTAQTRFFLFLFRLTPRELAAQGGASASPLRSTT
jgi:hypothetical protein